MKIDISEIIKRSIYLILIAIVLAYFEIQIEGSAGWAANLPTWRNDNPNITWIFGGRPVTGYHVALNLLLILFFHWPFILTKWDLIKESKILASFAILAVIWDFLWFVINPNFGLANYNNSSIWWFSKWFLGFPVDYYFGLLLSLIFSLLPSIFRKRSFFQALTSGILYIIICLLGTGIFTIVFINLIS